MHWSEYLIQTASAANQTAPASLYALAHDIFVAWQEGRTILTCGNGGSAANASHLAQDLSKGTIVRSAKRLRAICLCDSISSLTAWANDEGYEYVFSAQLTALAQPDDLLIAISGSGNSPNILGAVCHANTLGMLTWGITGFDGGELIEIADVCVRIPCSDMGRIEAVHSIVHHWLIDYLREAFQAHREHRLDELTAWAPPQ